MGRSHSRFVAAAIIGLALLTGCVTSPGKTSSTPASALPSQSSASATATSASAETITVPLGERPFQLYVPAGVSTDTSTALVVALHGYTADAASALSYFGLEAVADQHRFLLAAPEGTHNSEGDAFWNAASACCDFEGSGVDDSAYLVTVIDAVAAAYTIDPGRVYVVGHSNGGFMALRIACDHADRVAAVASLAGAMDADADCEPSQPVSVLQIHGDADSTVLFEGSTIEGNRHTSAEQTVRTWRELNACPAEAAHADKRWDADADISGADLSTTSWIGCEDATEVALWRIDGGRHVPSLTAEFSDALFQWLESHHRAER
ncbi:MAG TPA: alpha/beta fold hydrolase [Propionicimonas sp.]|nr:alpha/beta fold hydrolase [Propionicimonas sp.]